MGVPIHHHNQWYLRDLACMYAKIFIGVAYEWGGENPWGMDCSGFFSEIMAGVGIEKTNFRSTATGICNRYPIVWEPSQERPVIAEKGCAVGYGKDSVTHVMLALSPKHVIGATGGGSRTTDHKDADEQNAFVKIRPIDYRSDIRIVVDPFKITEE